MRACTFVFAIAALLVPVIAAPQPHVVARQERSSSTTPTRTSSQGASATTSLTGAQASNALEALTPYQDSILIQNLLNGPQGAKAYPGRR